MFSTLGCVFPSWSIPIPSLATNLLIFLIPHWQQQAERDIAVSAYTASSFPNSQPAAAWSPLPANYQRVWGWAYPECWWFDDATAHFNWWAKPDAGAGWNIHSWGWLLPWLVGRTEGRDVPSALGFRIRAVRYVFGSLRLFFVFILGGCRAGAWIFSFSRKGIRILWGVCCSFAWGWIARDLAWLERIWGVRITFRLRLIVFRGPVRSHSVLLLADRWRLIGCHLSFGTHSWFVLIWFFEIGNLRLVFGILSKTGCLDPPFLAKLSIYRNWARTSKAFSRVIQSRWGFLVCGGWCWVSLLAYLHQASLSSLLSLEYIALWQLGKACGWVRCILDRFSTILMGLACS